MGISLGKHPYSGSTSVSELQQKVLRHIFSVDGNNWDSTDVLKGCKRFGFTSLDHFLNDIPTHILKQFAVPKDAAFICGLGSRFVLKNDSRIRGECIDIKIKIPSDSTGFITFITIRLDQPQNGRVEPPLQMVYPMDDLFLEKHYLQEILHDRIKENDDYLLTTVKNLNSNSVSSNKQKSLTSKSDTHNIIKNFLPIKTDKESESGKKQESNSNKRRRHETIPSTPITKKLYSVVAPQPIVEPVTEALLTGKKRGIHGANNSCYMDSLLFSLFYTTTKFNSVFLRKKAKDSEDAVELRRILEENIATPLTTSGYCSSTSLGELRAFLSKFDDRFLGSMMDIEELVYQMLEDILDEPHFLQYNNDTEDYIHQILTEAEGSDKQSDENNAGNVTDLQTCLQNSFKLWGDLKLIHCPNPAFLIQFPRSDGDLLAYDGILPNHFLNIRPFLISSEQDDCSCCLVEFGEWECGVCSGPILGICSKCVKNLETFPGCNHNVSSLRSKTILELQSIICINSAHYTAIVKSAEGVKGHWLYFDSMAGTYPEVTLLNDFETNLRQVEASIDNGIWTNNSPVNKWINKAMQDCHICIYLPTTWTQSDTKHDLVNDT